MLSHGICSSQVGATVRSKCGNLTVAAAQFRERLQHRQIGLTGAVQIDALPPRASDVAKSSHKVLNQRGFADPGFAGNPDHCALAAERAGPEAAQPRERFRATDEPRLGLPPSRRSVHLCDRSGCRYGGWDGNEPIASARHRFDKAWLARIITEHRPQIADRRLENRVGDELVTPYVVQQSVLDEQRAGPSDQRTEKGEGRWRERNRLSTAEQRGVRFIEFELVEVNQHRVRDSCGTSHGVTSCHWRAPRSRGGAGVFHAAGGSYRRAAAIITPMARDRSTRISEVLGREDAGIR